MAIDVTSIVLPAVGAVGTVKSAVEHYVEFSKLAAHRPEPQQARREALHELFRLSSLEHSAPTVVVLDDAPALTAESLYLLSGLVAKGPPPESNLDDLMGETKLMNQFLPLAAENRISSPLLFVCTAWEHRFLGRFEDPFLTWLHEMEELPVVIDWVPCEQFEIGEAASILQSAKCGVDSEQIRKVIKHIQTSSPEGELVNPLVLTSVIAKINEEREGWGSSFELDDTAIAALPNVPDQHVRDRLEMVKETAGVGARAYSLFAMLAHYSQQVPLKLLDILAGYENFSNMERLKQLLTDQYLWVLTEWNASKSIFRVSELVELDPDVHRYLQREDLPKVINELLTTCCADLLDWCIKFGMRNNRSAVPGGKAAFFTLVSGANRVLARRLPDRPSAIAVALSLLRWNEEPPPGASVPSRGYGYGVGLHWDLSDDDIARSIKHFGDSWISPLIAQRRLNDLREIESCCEGAIAELASVNERIFFPIARRMQRLGHFEDAAEILEELVWEHRDAAPLLAQIYLRQGRKDLALETLRRRANDFSQCAIQLASLLVENGELDEAIRVLQPYLETVHEVGPLMAQINLRRGRKDLAFEVLQAAAGRWPHSALRFGALILEDNGPAEAAVPVLEPYLQVDPGAAPLLAQIYLRQGRKELAKQVLGPAARRFSLAANRLAALILDDGGPVEAAIPVLEPFLQVDPESAPLLAQIYLRQGRKNLAIEVLQAAAGRFSLAAGRLAALHFEDGEPAEAMRVLRTATAAFPDAAVSLARELLRLGQPDEACDVLEPYVETLENAAGLYANVRVAQGQVDLALARLETIAAKNADVSVILAKALRKTNPQKSIELLTPWAPQHGFAAAELVRELLHTGQTAKARDYLSAARPILRRDGLAIAISLLSGDFSEGARLLSAAERAHQKNNRVFFVLNTLMANMADCGRPDLIQWILEECDTPNSQRTAASYVLTFCFNEQKRAGGADPDAVVATIWPHRDQSASACRAIEPILWRWVQDPELVEPPLNCFSALSLVQTFFSLSTSVPARLKFAVLERLKDFAQGTPEMYVLVRAAAPLSPVAAEVYEDVLAPANLTLENSAGAFLDGDDV
ncbi:CDC27 family protein [Arthrobacter nitrophenolicus]